LEKGFYPEDGAGSGSFAATVARAVVVPGAKCAQANSLFGIMDSSFILFLL